MKPTVVILIALVFCNCTKLKHELPDYVEFSTNTAIITHLPPNPLFVSTKKVDIHLNEHELADLKSIIENRYKDSEVLKHLGLRYRNAQFLKRRNELLKTDRDTNKITGQDKENYINLKYARMVTDKKTFTEIVDFIFNNKNNYTKGDRESSPDAQGFEINLGKNTKFLIDFKSKGSFLINLRADLSSKQCDKRVIEELGVL